jgi:hypothetical protein
MENGYYTTEEKIIGYNCKDEPHYDDKGELLYTEYMKTPIYETIKTFIEYTEEEIVSHQISSLKKELKKIKEDVEQVELFGMTRSDYEEKKARCRAIVLELRELENRL